MLAAAVNFIYVLIVIYYGVQVAQQLLNKKKAERQDNSLLESDSGVAAEVMIELQPLDQHDDVDVGRQSQSPSHGDIVVSAAAVDEKKHTVTVTDDVAGSKEPQPRERKTAARTSTASPTRQDPSPEAKPVVRVVIAKYAFNANNPVQLSFCQGDVIQEVNATGNWHRGILLICCGSGRHAITGKVLSYPSNFVTLPGSARTHTHPIEPDQPPREGSSTNVEASSLSSGNVVMTRVAYQAKKPNQMSFGKGDLIEVRSTKGNWHKGVLIKSESHILTGQIKLYPKTFVRRHTATTTLYGSV